MKNKYRVAAKERRTWEGRVYASRAEMLYAQQLDIELHAGEILSIEEQPVVTLGVPENRYIPDFRVVNRRGEESWIDVKGVETQMFRRNVRLWRAYGPGPLLVVKHLGRGRFETTKTIIPIEA